MAKAGHGPKGWGESSRDGTRGRSTQSSGGGSGRHPGLQPQVPSRRHSPVVAAQREGALRGGGRAALEVVDAPLVDDDEAEGPCGQRGRRG